jgi:hypothetical protein
MQSGSERVDGNLCETQHSWYHLVLYRADVRCSTLCTAVSDEGYTHVVSFVPLQLFGASHDVRLCL